MWLEKFNGITLSISTYCNAACPQCHRLDPNGLKKVPWLPLSNWTLDDIKKALPIKDLGKYNWISFCGTWGDPLMNKDLHHIVKYIADNSDTKISIDTNGSLRDEDFFWELGEVAREKLTVIFDIDGHTQEMHSLYRRNTNLQKILSNMETLSLTPAHCHVHTIVFKHNQDHLQKIAEMVKSHGASRMIATVSDRFEKGPTFNFIDKDIEYQLERADNDHMQMAKRWKVFG